MHKRYYVFYDAEVRVLFENVPEIIQQAAVGGPVNQLSYISLARVVRVVYKCGEIPFPDGLPLNDTGEPSGLVHLSSVHTPESGWYVTTPPIAIMDNDGVFSHFAVYIARQSYLSPTATAQLYELVKKSN